MRGSLALLALCLALAACLRAPEAPPPATAPAVDHLGEAKNKLSDTIGNKPKWRLKVALEPGQDLALDLSPDNGVPRRDDFPASTASGPRSPSP